MSVRTDPFVLVSLLCFFGAGLFAQVSSSGAILHLSMDAPAKGSWNKVTDSSPKGNHGSLVGTAGYEEDRFGVGCSAMVFDGSSYIRIPNSASLSSPYDGITISVWVYLDAGSDPFNEWLAICCKGNDPMESANCPQYRMHATAQTVSINTEFTRMVTGLMSTEVWYHYAFTYDGSEFSAYLDGNLIFREPYIMTFEENDMDLEIGRDVPGKTEYFRGRMDDLRIYDRSLSSREIAALYSDRSGAAAPDRCRGSRAGSNPSANTTAPVGGTPTQSIPQPVPSVKPADPVQVVSSPKPDTVIVYRDLLPDTLEGVPLSYQHDVTVSSRQVEIYLYDGEEQDGDTVSVAVNGVWVKEDLGLMLEQSVPPKGSVIRCVLFPGKNNYLVSKACNLGKKGLNTLSMAIQDGKGIQVVTINSKIGESGAIRIDCRE